MAEKELSEKILQIISQLDVLKLRKAGLIVEECNPQDPHVRIRRGPKVLHRIYNEEEVIAFCAEDPRAKLDYRANELLRRIFPVNYHQLGEKFYRLLHSLPPLSEVKLAYQKV